MGDSDEAFDGPEPTLADDTILHFACGHSERFAMTVWTDADAQGNPAIGSVCGHGPWPLCYSPLVRIEVPT